MRPTYRIRQRPILEQQLAALRELDQTGRATAFQHGALAALTWMIEGGPGPLTGALTARPVPSRAIVAELATAEELIYGRPSPRRDYARGVEHALMWAQHATAAAPLAPPARSHPTRATPDTREVPATGSAVGPITRHHPARVGWKRLRAALTVTAAA